MTTSTTTAIDLIARLSANRAVVRDLLGPFFEATMEDHTAILNKIASLRNCSVLEAAMLACRDCDNPRSVAIIMAAALEAIERS